MGSKGSTRSGLHQDEGHGFAARGQGAAHLLLQRIASALQVPPSALYSPSHAIDGHSPSVTASVSSGGSKSEREELLSAFQRVTDPGDRRRIVALTQKMAERR